MQVLGGVSWLCLLAAVGRAQSGLDGLRTAVQSGLGQAREGLATLGGQAAAGLATASKQLVQISEAKQAAAGQVLTGIQAGINAGASALSGTPLGPGLDAAGRAVAELGAAAQSGIASVGAAKVQGLNALAGGAGQVLAAAQRGAGAFLDGVQSASSLAFDLAG